MLRQFGRLKDIPFAASPELTFLAYFLERHL